MLLRLRLRGVHAAAAAEGLTLLRAESSTGFKGVSRSKSVTTPFKARREENLRRKRKRAIDADAVEVKVEVKEEPRDDC